MLHDHDHRFRLLLWSQLREREWCIGRPLSLMRGMQANDDVTQLTRHHFASLHHTGTSCSRTLTKLVPVAAPQSTAAFTAVCVCWWAREEDSSLTTETDHQTFKSSTTTNTSECSPQKLNFLLLQTTKYIERERETKRKSVRARGKVKQKERERKRENEKESKEIESSDLSDQYRESLANVQTDSGEVEVVKSEK